MIAVVLALEADHAIEKWRDTIGASNPANATEIPFFFAACELLVAQATSTLALKLRLTT